MLGDPSHESDDAAGRQAAADVEPANWVVAKTFHGTPRDPVSKVVVRPNRAGLRTTMMVDSDCGAFRYRLISTESSANATVRFRQEKPNLGLPEPPYAEDEEARPVIPSCADTTVSQAVHGYTVYFAKDYTEEQIQREMRRLP